MVRDPVRKRINSPKLDSTAHRIVVDIFICSSFRFVWVQAALLREASLWNSIVQESLRFRRVPRASYDDGVLYVRNLTAGRIQSQVLMVSLQLLYSDILPLGFVRSRMRIYE